MYNQYLLRVLLLYTRKEEMYIHTLTCHCCFCHLLLSGWQSDYFLMAVENWRGELGLEPDTVHRLRYSCTLYACFIFPFWKRERKSSSLYKSNHSEHPPVKMSCYDRFLPHTKMDREAHNLRTYSCAGHLPLITMKARILFKARRALYKG